MKNYRLIKYDVTGRRIEHGTEYFSTLEEAAKQMLGHSEITYRIEEFEESITDRVKSYEDACKVTGDTNVDDYDYLEWYLINKDGTRLNKPLPDHTIALIKLETITAVLNEGWKPDWEDETQKKWTPLFQVALTKGERPTIEFIEADWVYFSETPIISRLYFKSRELAEYAAKQFKELYEQLLIEKL